MANPKIDTETAITELGVGEALISLLDEKGRPTPVERAFVLPPTSQIGPITAAERQAIMKSSLVAGVYDQTVDRESAYEVLKARAAQEDQGAPSAKEVIAPPPAAAATTSIFGSIFGGDDAKETKKAPSRQSDTLFEATAKSVLRSVGTQLGKQIVRGVLGSIMGGRR
ncbi:unnamed protein product [Darwinula stevensoni]|uniref:Helicase HerA-like C-terminal domain-containing protein n=1 Tax=Darwinula stevensoni TaxID=69355 RepID=A0A7R9AGT1_9CRUS|nr:unnamed protein product [Darwinula stevensoni]CAG0904805.1 unnamed protein product [Darwinula stevensoni]